MRNKNLPSLLVDFDGVIHSYEKGWDDGTIYGTPIPGAKETLEELSKNYRIIIFTTRVKPDDSEERSQVNDVLNWLNKYDIHWDTITGWKLPAKAIIDDRAIQFIKWESIPFQLTELLLRKA